MPNPKTPKHFTRDAFDMYILECAIRDRLTYLDAMQSSGIHNMPEDELKYCNETREEICTMRNRLEDMRKKAAEKAHRQMEKYIPAGFTVHL